MRRHEDLGKTPAKISRGALIALLLAWLALPALSFGFYQGQHPAGGRPYWGDGVGHGNWGAPYAGARQSYGYRPISGRSPYFRTGAWEPPQRGQQARPPYHGGHFQSSRPPYQAGHPQQARPPYQGAYPQSSRPPYRPDYRPPYQGGPGNGVGRAPYQRRPDDELHLPGWIQQHGNMPLADQERALENEPGFRQLAPDSQQRILQSLRHIESLPPEQRQRTLGYIEAMERLSPARRQQVTASVYAIRTLPPDRRRMITMALRDLIQYPPQERQSIMSQRQFQSQFSPEERNILSNILAVEPYQPHIGPPPGPPFQPGR